jgi:hypothetical protein
VFQNEWGNGMGMSKRTRETLIDLVEIKLSCLEVIDREDARELANLERCLGELRKAMSGEVVDFPQSPRKVLLGK